VRTIKLPENAEYRRIFELSGRAESTNLAIAVNERHGIDKTPDFSYDRPTKPPDATGIQFVGQAGSGIATAEHDFS